MNKEQKVQLVEELAAKFEQYPNFYVADTGGLDVATVNDLRRDCFKKEIPMQVVKNTLIKKALEKLDGDYTEMYDAFKLHSAIFFAGEENPSGPAKVIKAFRKKSEKPVLKAASIEHSFFIGDEQLELLANLKSKNELIGEVITLLQSPAKTVIAALQSGGQTISGLVKTLSEREA